MLIWDYESGTVVNLETGEVVDMIYEFDRKDIEVTRNIGTMTKEDIIALKGTEIVKELKRRGLKDVRGTYVAYKLGMTNKTVKSLKRDVDIEIPEELKNEVERILHFIEKDPLLSARSERGKTVLAVAAAMVMRGKTVREACKMLGVNEKRVRKLLGLLRRRML